ncbi:alpha/beta-hydrolase [Astrocystis sublimbata]|nr:alpha/beta-hydrolase [Astrocystis sublimbata]
MPNDTKPALLFIIAGWHTPDTYKKLTSALELRGFEVHAPRLPSTNGTRPPDADYFTDCEFIRNYAKSLIDAGRTVAAYMHQYGCHVGSNALYGLGLEARAKQGQSGGISHLICVSPYILPEGKSMLDKVEQFGSMGIVDFVLSIDEDGTCLFPDAKGLMVGPLHNESEASLAEIEECIETLSRWNTKCMSQAADHAAWREIPVSWIHTLKDMVVPTMFQINMMGDIEKAGHKVQAFEINAAHCPHLRATEHVIRIVEEILSG